MNKNAIKLWAALGAALGATAEDFQNVTPQPKPSKPVNTNKSPFTAEEALRLHKLHNNWATVARLMGRRKADVLSLVHKTDPVSQSKARQPASTPAEGLTIKEATRIALSGKNYKTMREIVSAVREQDICRPAYTRTVDVHVHQLIRDGQVKVRKEIGQLTGYKLVG